MLGDLSFGEVQGGLFDTRDHPRDDRLMAALDEVNRKMGAGTLRPAATGVTPKGWRMKREHCSRNTPPAGEVAAGPNVTRAGQTTDPWR